MKLYTDPILDSTRIQFEYLSSYNIYIKKTTTKQNKN